VKNTEHTQGNENRPDEGAFLGEVEQAVLMDSLVFFQCCTFQELHLQVTTIDLTKSLDINGIPIEDGMGIESSHFHVLFGVAIEQQGVVSF